MLNLGCLGKEMKKKRKRGTGSAGGQNELLLVLSPLLQHRKSDAIELLGPVSRQGFLCRDRVAQWPTPAHATRARCVQQRIRQSCIPVRDRARGGAVDGVLSRQKTYVTTDRPQSLGRDGKFSIGTRVVQLCVTTDILFRDRARGWYYDSVSYCEPPAEPVGAGKTSASHAIEHASTGATEEFRRDREFSITTNFVVFSVMTRKSLSR